MDGLWEAVRGWIDDVGEKGLFVLTGSATPADGGLLHTGARRIAPVSMRTMAFLERGLSSGAVSVGGLLEGQPPPAVSDGIPVAAAVEALAVGGWPTNLGLSVDAALDAALRTIGRTADEPLGDVTLRDYVRALQRLFLIEDQNAWRPSLRSRVRLAATPKRHLADPSLAVAALGATPKRLFVFGAILVAAALALSFTERLRENTERPRVGVLLT